MKVTLDKAILGKSLLVFSLFLLFLYLQFDLGQKFRLDADWVYWQAKIRETYSSFLSIILAAFPFIILGIAISIIIGVFVRENFILKFIPKNRFLSHLAMATGGVIMPVCECGNIPVARRFLMKGLAPSQVLAFLLAAPIVNPITLITTLEAFNLDWKIALMRIMFGLGIAYTIAIVFSCKKVQNDVLSGIFNSRFLAPERCDTSPASKLKQAEGIFYSEFVEMFKMLLFGALIASLIQNFIPREILFSIGSNPVFSIIAMIILAFVISVCSSVDAFIALAYSSTFTLGSIMAFLVFGPMIDIKMLSMLRSTIKPKYLLLISLIVFSLSFTIGLGINYFYKEFYLI